MATEFLIVHHNDPDGWASAAVAYNYAKEKCIEVELGYIIELIEMSYDKDPNLVLDKVNKDVTVIMVDFSFKMDVMKKIADGAKRFYWIDHHISAIKDFEANIDLFHENINLDNDDYAVIQLNKDFAACQLTWMRLFPNKKIPEAINLIGIYDNWKKEDPRWEDALSTFFGIRTFKDFNKPESHLWDEIVNSNREAKNKISFATIDDQIIEAGRIARSYQDNINIEIVNRAAFITKLSYPTNGEMGYITYSAVACNSPLCNSMIFDSINTDKYDLMISFYQSNNKTFNISFYTKNPEIDCSLIAKFFGGGGHRGAAGATLNYLPFELTTIKPEFKNEM